MSATRKPRTTDIAPERAEPESNGFGRERVTGVQRARMLSAMAEVCAERGAANVTVAHVVERAGVSRRTFYELFDDCEDCFLAAFEDALARIAARVVPAFETPGTWRERLRAALVELLWSLDDDPGAGRLVVVETLGAGRGALERRGRVLAQVIRAVDGGRTEAKKGDDPPALTAEGIVGGVLSVLHTRLSDETPQSFIELTGPLMSMIVLPYFGPAAARRELSRPLPKAPPRPHATSANPLLELQMRLTYRTIRVLMAIAAHPGSSNRAIADASEVTDQGQISKLLARLEHLDLIRNAGTGAKRGEPNAWTLTNKGRQLQGAVTEQPH